MSSLYKRASPSQYRMLRIIAGAVENAAHAHRASIPHNFARSVAKRATGTLTAQWPDVLAAKTDRRQKPATGHLTYPAQARRAQISERAEGDRQTFKRRSPLRALWAELSRDLWKIKRSNQTEKYLAYIHLLQIIDRAALKDEGVAISRPHLSTPETK